MASTICNRFCKDAGMLTEVENEPAYAAVLIIPPLVPPKETYDKGRARRARRWCHELRGHLSRRSKCVKRQRAKHNNRQSEPASHAHAHTASDPENIKPGGRGR